MGFWEKFVGAPEPETRDAPASRDVSWNLLAAGVPHDGGGFVSANVAEGLSAVYGAVRLVSEAVASLPCMVYRRTAEGREEAGNHPVARVLQQQASEFFTGPEMIEAVTASALLNGAGYAEIVRGGAGQVLELRPLPFGSVSPVQLPGGKLAYDVSDVDGSRTRRLLSSEVFGIFDRRDGNPFQIRSRLNRCAATVAGALSAERFSQSVFDNQASVGGVLAHPGKLSKDAHSRLRDSFESRFSGASRAGKTLILEEAMSWTATAAHPDESQLLESRRFNVEQVGRLYGVPSPLLGDMSKSAYGNVVELSKQFLQFGVAPWLVKWERRIALSLFSEATRGQYEIEFDSDVLLRANLLERYQSFRIGREIGLLSANEIRAWEKLNRRTDSGGDEFLRPSNMQSEQTSLPKDGEPQL